MNVLSMREEEITKYKPILFFHPVMIFIQVDQEHFNDVSQCWHTPRLLNRNKMYKKKKSQEYYWNIMRPLLRLPC